MTSDEASTSHAPSSVWRETEREQPERTAVGRIFDAGALNTQLYLEVTCSCWLLVVRLMAPDAPLQFCFNLALIPASVLLRLGGTWCTRCNV